MAAIASMATIAGCGPASHGSSSGRVTVVAAENEYGSMVKAIGGNHVAVTSLLSNPNADPHEFEASASTAEVVAKERLVVENGLGYDAWVDRLLSASPRSGRLVFNVGGTLGRHVGDNPHIWYDPSGWPREAHVITRDLSHLAPAEATYFRRRGAAWLRSLQPVYREIASFRRQTAGSRVIATEPVYGYMIAALGATSLDPAFQKAAMDGIDPPPQAVAQFESVLTNHRARVLFYNSQVVDPITARMRQLAQRSHVPVAGITETQPRLSFVQWQLTQLRNVRNSWETKPSM